MEFRVALAVLLGFILLMLVFVVYLPSVIADEPGGRSLSVCDSCAEVDE